MNIPHTLRRKKRLVDTKYRTEDLKYMGVPYIFTADAPITPVFVPEVVFLITKHGLIEEYRRSIRLMICRQIEDPLSFYDNNQFLWFDDSKPLYVGRWDGTTIIPFEPPDPTEIKLTSISLFAKVVTYPKSITRWIIRNLRLNQKDTGNKSMFLWMIAVLFTILLIVFMLAVTIVSGGKEDVTAVPEVYTAPGYSAPVNAPTPAAAQPQADLSIPEVVPPPVNYAQQIPNDAAKGVPIE